VTIRVRITKVTFDTDGNDRLARELSEAWTGRLVELDDVESDDAVEAALLERLSNETGWLVSDVAYESVDVQPE
jgi:hypothetical protein